MFRTKIILTHALLVGLLIGAAHMLMRGKVESDIEQSQESSLRRAAVIGEQNQRLDHSALKEKGEAIAEGIDLYKYMTLEERPDLYDQLKEKYSDVDAEKKLGKEKKKEAESEDGIELSTTDVRHLAVHEKLLAWKYRFQEWAKNAGDKRNLDRMLEKREPMRPEMVMAVDRNGVGVAALGQDRYSWFGQNLAEDHQILTDVTESSGVSPKLDIWRFAWGPGDDPSVYQVAIAPIRRNAGERPAGAIVVGYMMHQEAAQDIQKLVAGVTSEETSETVEQDDLEAAPEIAFFRGRNLVSSTVSSTTGDKLIKKLFDEKGVLEENTPDELLEVELEGDQYMALVRFFPGEFDTDKPVGFVMLSNLSEAKSPVNAVLSSFNMYGIGAIIVGALLLFFFFQRFIRPVETIENTIADVLSGQDDAEFVLSRDHAVFSSLAQGLNLMSAYLRDAPMPDEQEELEGWDDVVGGGGPGGGGPGGGGGGGGGAGGGSPDVAGVEMPGMGGGGDDSDDKS